MSSNPNDRHQFGPNQPDLNSPALNPSDLNQPTASFDCLGLPVDQLASAQPTAMNQVAFQMLQLKRLLESAFQLEGFNQATASRHAEAQVVVEYMPAEKQYRSF